MTLYYNASEFVNTNLISALSNQIHEVGGRGVGSSGARVGGG